MSSIKHHVTGMEYWRSLEQLAEGPRVAELLEQEFAGYDPDTIAGTSRRGFMKLMGAAMALAGVTLTGCRRWPSEELAPYSSNPRGITPGVPEQYATLWEMGGVASGLLVTSYDGRPVKIEGNSTHPSSRTARDKAGNYAYGSADAFAQASLLEMYDPERSRQVVDRSAGSARHTGWADFLAAAQPMFASLKANKGARFAVLSEASSSPSVWAMRRALLTACPQARWFEYEPVSRDNDREGANMAFGRVQRTVLHLDKADVVVLLDADVLGTHPNHTRYANDWAQKRRSADADKAEDKRMSRVYMAESALSITGAVADKRLAVDPARIYAIAYAIGSRLAPPKFAGVTPPGATLVAPDDHKLTAAELAFVDSAVKDLKEIGNGVVAVGPTASPETHAMVHGINGALGAVGNTVTYFEEVDTVRPTHIQAIADLTAALNSGTVDTLLVIGGNPVYDAPSDLNFPAALAKAGQSMHLSLYDNETSLACKWHLNRAHYLECWGDGASWDGVVTLQQPVIMPLYDGKSPIELLALMLGDGPTEGREIIRQTAEAPKPGADGAADFEKKFRSALEAGFFPSEKGVAVDATLKFPQFPAPPAPAASGFTLRFDSDSRAYDGRFANNGWLQETPDPLSKLMWDNALLMSVRDARDPKMNLTQGELVELTVPGGAKLIVPVCLLPGQPVGVVSLSLGYGRTAAGHIGDNLGVNAYSIRTSASPWIVPGVQIKPTGDKYELATSAEHHLLDPMAMAAEKYRIGEKNKTGKIVREATLAEYKEAPEDLGGKTRKVSLQLFAPPTQDNFRDLHAWGMSIDLSACIGCNACAVACQAENNIPVVGKEQCLRHREMNWIRIDRYFKGEIEDPEPEVVFQPMTCQHCENAPCEQVCPVAATVHDAEGLNTMVYNRCIGTRYCSNNCPYKVRRFNYFDFHSQDPRANSKWLKNAYLNIPDTEQQDPTRYKPVTRMMYNPDVTVRMRGVMEKCTYCVQRIHGAVITQRGQGKDVVDGDIVTACQQACPTQAIVFGNLNDAESKVSQLQQSPRAYDVLHEELDTRPRTRYLVKMRNPEA